MVINFSLVLFGLLGSVDPVAATAGSNSGTCSKYLLLDWLDRPPAWTADPVETEMEVRAQLDELVTWDELHPHDPIAAMLDVFFDAPKNGTSRRFFVSYTPKMRTLSVGFYASGRTYFDYLRALKAMDLETSWRLGRLHHRLLDLLPLRPREAAPDDVLYVSYELEVSTRRAAAELLAGLVRKARAERDPASHPVSDDRIRHLDNRFIYLDQLE